MFRNLPESVDLRQAVTVGQSEADGSSSHRSKDELEVLFNAEPL